MHDPFEAAQKEHMRWRERERRLGAALVELEAEQDRLESELGKIEQQVSYYDSLTRDMKRALGRPTFSGLLSSLRRP